MISIQMATVTGYRTGEFLGLGNSQIIRVKIESDPDAQDALLICPPGDESAPAEGDRVPVFTIYNFRIALGGTDAVAPSIAAGEKLLYSRDSAGAVAAFIKFLSSGILELNGSDDFAVRFSALESAFNQLKADFNAHGHVVTTPDTINGTASPTTPGSTADVSGAKIENIKVPGVTP